MSNKPKPTELRLLEGNRSHRPIPNNPDPEKVFPKPPKWLDRTGKKEWRKRGKELYNLGLLTILDLPAFGIYCDMYSEYEQAKKVKESEEYKNLNFMDQLKVDKEIRIAKDKYAQQVRMYDIEFGMTPSSRTRLDVKEVTDDKSSIMEKLIK